MDLQETFRCPVCLEVPHEDILVCIKGHDVCIGCRNRLSECPVCRSALTHTRNLLMEKLIASLMLEDDRPLSPIQTADLALRCAFKSCHKKRERMSVAALKSHLEQAHHDDYTEFQNDTHTFKHGFSFVFSNSNNSNMRAFSVSNMGLFFLNVYVVSENCINIWITSPSKKEICDSLHYKVVFTKGENTNLAYKNVVSMLVGRLRVLESHRVVIIDPEHHKLEEGNNFHIDLSVIYKKKNGEYLFLLAA